MSASTYTLIGLGLCVMIVLALCIIAVRRFDMVGISEVVEEPEEDVLELSQLSFDQVVEPDGIETAEIEAIEDPGEEDQSHDGPSPTSTSPTADAPPTLPEVSFGIRPERLVPDGARPRLEFSMALLNQSEITMVSLRILTDLVVYDPEVEQGVRPCAPNLRQDTLARLAPGERIFIQGNWSQPEELPAFFAGPDQKGAYLLARARIIGANVAPKSHYFLFGHLENDSRLLPIRNTPEVLENLGVSEAIAEDEDE